MEADEVIQKFRETGALLEGHFVLSSGSHSGFYLQCALVLQYSRYAEEFGDAIARHFMKESVQVVASPAIGGLIIGYEVARALGARFIWTERENEKMTLRRGFTVAPGERLLVVEDVVTTGGSTRETVATLQSSGAKVIAAASIVDRSSGKADVGVPRIALATLNVSSVDPSECDACIRGEPAIKPGSRQRSKE